MKTNISLLIGLCVLIAGNSVIGMERKSYLALKNEFIKANDRQNPDEALEKAAVLKQCFNDPVYLEHQYWSERREARKAANMLDEYEGKLLDTTVVLGALGLGLKFKKNIHSAIPKTILSAATASMLGTAASCAGTVYYLNKEYNVSRLNAFDDEKEWLINQLKSLKGLPSEHTTRLNKELENTFKEKLAQKHA